MKTGNRCWRVLIQAALEPNGQVGSSRRCCTKGVACLCWVARPIHLTEGRINFDFLVGGGGRNSRTATRGCSVAQIRCSICPDAFYSCRMCRKMRDQVIYKRLGSSMICHCRESAEKFCVCQLELSCIKKWPSDTDFCFPSPVHERFQKTMSSTAIGELMIGNGCTATEDWSPQISVTQSHDHVLSLTGTSLPEASIQHSFTGLNIPQDHTKPKTLFNEYPIMSRESIRCLVLTWLDQSILLDAESLEGRLLFAIPKKGPFTLSY